MVNLKVTKSSNSQYLFLGASNRIVYSILIENIGTSKATCVRVKDIMDDIAEIIPNTVKVDGCGKDVILSDMSISVGTIEAGGNSIITYEVEVSKNCIKGAIVNKAIVSYCDNECCNHCNRFVEESNVVFIPIINIDVKVLKSVDKPCARVGEVISYSVVVRNNSNVAIENVIFTDYVPVNLEIYPASVLINGVPQYTDDLEDIDLGTINPYSSVIIEFKGKILNMSPISTIKNSASVSFEYFVIENGIEIDSEGSACSNDVFTRVIEGKCCC